MAKLKLFHVNKIYDGKVHAIKDFSLDINDGEFVVFVGPSGCGKSTTLRMIAGLEKATSGDLYIGDRLVNGLPAKDRNIAMVFQSYALFPNMSVYDNISFGLRMQGEDKAVIKEKVEKVAEMLNLSEYLTRKPSQLSGGQKQRVALGRAIVRQPDVFLLDEPLSNLDAKLRNRMRKEIQALHIKLGATFIYVTHDQTEAMTMGDKIVVMRDGVIMQVGSPDKLYRYPSNKFVAGFIGMPQMNFWQGETVLTANGVIVKTAQGEFPITGELSSRLSEDAFVNGKKVILGVRPEFVTTERKKDTDVEVTIPVGVIEELCTHTVLHGYLDSEEVVGYGQSGFTEIGKTLSFYVDIDELHLFDKETEESLIPEYAPAKTVKTSKTGTEVDFLGEKIVISASQASAVKDGKVTLTVPVNAYKKGNIPFVFKRLMTTEIGDVSLITIGGTDVYAAGDFSNASGIGIDISKITIEGEGKVEGVKDVSKLKFTYFKENGEADGRKVTKHYLDFGGEKIEAYYDFNKKMYRLGKDVFKNEYVLDLPLTSVRVAVDDEVYPTVKGVAEKTCNYDDKSYSLVSVGKEKLYVAGALEQGNEVMLAFDLDNARVETADTETILF